MDKILSIIVPSYNMEAYLPKCLGSLVVDDKDLLQKLDVIVVNDGSKDRTSGIAHEFEAKYPGVFRVIDKENGHYGSCINAALPVALGFYIKVLDADDWFATDHFRNYLVFLEAERAKGTDLIVNDFEFVDNDETILKTYAWIAKESTVADFDFSAGHDLWMHAVAYRTDNLRAIHYRQLTGMTHTDIQWVHLPMATVESFAYFPNVLYEYQYLRAGNTCEHDEFYRTYAIQEKILKCMVEEYLALKRPIGEAQNTYLRNHLLYRARRAYHVHLIERSPLLNDASLVELDSFLRDHARWIYDACDHLRFSNKISWRYVRSWRKRQRYSLCQRIERKCFDLILWGRGKIRRRS